VASWGILVSSCRMLGATCTRVTPEPGGLDWYQVTDLLREVSFRREVVGFDVVELCPSKAKASDFLAAKLVYKLLSYRFCKGR